MRLLIFRRKPFLDTACVYLAIINPCDACERVQHSLVKIVPVWFLAMRYPLRRIDFSQQSLRSWHHENAVTSDLKHVRLQRTRLPVCQLNRCFECCNRMRFTARRFGWRVHASRSVYRCCLCSRLSNWNSRHIDFNQHCCRSKKSPPPTHANMTPTVTRRRRVASINRFYDSSPDPFRHLWHYGVSKSSQSVHPSGNPMSHSTHVGFNAPLVSSAAIT